MMMKESDIETIMFAPCGMNCKVCYKHCYHKKPCDGCLKSDYHKKPCDGCLKSDRGKPEHCRRCKIKDCVKARDLSYCYACSDYPCKLVNYRQLKSKRLLMNACAFIKTFCPCSDTRNWYVHRTSTPSLSLWHT